MKSKLADMFFNSLIGRLFSRQLKHTMRIPSEREKGIFHSIAVGQLINVNGSEYIVSAVEIVPGNEKRISFGTFKLIIRDADVALIKVRETRCGSSWREIPIIGEIQKPHHLSR